MAPKSTDEKIATLVQGYTFSSPTIDLGAAIVDEVVQSQAQVRLPLAMMNRHGLVAGATGTGKTVTLQVMAEQLSRAGVPVFLADIKGDLTGLASPGAGGEKLLKRTAELGQQWSGESFPVEFLALGGNGRGVPVRASITSFGPILLSRVMDLNETQESSLQLVFHFADKNGLELDDLKDLRAVIQFLTSAEGKAALADLGGLSKATAGVILRELIALQAQGLEPFFGLPEFDPAELLRLSSDGRGVITALELPTLQNRPALFSTFLMWLLAELFETLPEAGDLDKPKLVFFFDEAHLLFKGASKAFLEAITQTVRLIRSKGVGIFFVTQTPKDVPAEVLGQLANRIQHALRAFTPDDAKALKATVSTFPLSDYELDKVLTSAGIGEAVVTVMNEKGAPTPVALTRLRAPQSLMGASSEETVAGIIGASTLAPRYGQAEDRRSAFEVLKGTGEAAGTPDAQGAAEAASAQPPAPDPAVAPYDVDEEARRIEAEILGRPYTAPPVPTSTPAPTATPGTSTPPATTPPAPRAEKPAAKGPARAPRSTPERSDSGSDAMDGLAQVLGGGLRSMVRSLGTQLGRDLGRSVFGTSSRKRRR